MMKNNYLSLGCTQWNVCSNRVGQGHNVITQVYGTDSWLTRRLRSLSLSIGGMSCQSARPLLLTHYVYVGPVKSRATARAERVPAFLLRKLHCLCSLLLQKWRVILACAPIVHAWYPCSSVWMPKWLSVSYHGITPNNSSVHLEENYRSESVQLSIHVCLEFSGSFPSQPQPSPGLISHSPHCRAACTM